MPRVDRADGAVAGEHALLAGVREGGAAPQAEALLILPQCHRAGRHELHRARQGGELALVHEALAEGDRRVAGRDAHGLLQDLRPEAAPRPLRPGERRHGERDGAAGDADPAAQRGLDRGQARERRQQGGVDHHDPARVALQEVARQQSRVHVVEHDEQLGLRRFHRAVQGRGEVLRRDRVSAGVGAPRLTGVVLRGLLEAVAEEVRLRELAAAEHHVLDPSGPGEGERRAARVGAHHGHEGGGGGGHGRGLDERLQRRDLRGAGQHHHAHARHGPGVLERGQDLREGQRDPELREHEPGPLRPLQLHARRARHAGDELAHHDGLLLHLAEHLLHALDVLLGDHEDHAEAAVERGGQLAGLHLAHGGEPAEGGRQLPGVGLEPRGELLGQHGVAAASEAAPRHVRRALDEPLLGELQDRLGIDARGRQEGLAEAPRGVEGRRLRVLQARGSGDGPDQGEAVAVEAGRRQGHEDVARLHLAHLRQPLRLLHRADREAHEVAAAGREDPGKLGDACVKELAPRLDAAIGHALDELHRLVRVELLDGQVLVEEERVGALRGELVHAERHEVDAGGVVVVHEGRDLELGAQRARGADQRRVLPLGHIVGLAAQLCHVLPALPRPQHHRLEAGQRSLARSAVHARGAVGELTRR
mmetsp:Transcript_56464/g.148476  ORF Transcript_56464/g.148476 Transcript_56464/m.148476 type:complete len:649 (+) Transcript_56464:377-2323(+)